MTMTTTTITGEEGYSLTPRESDGVGGWLSHCSNVAIPTSGPGTDRIALVLARWMLMPCCTNQASVAKAWQEFDDDGRMKASDIRDRVVDCSEEHYRFTLIIMREYTPTS